MKKVCCANNTDKNSAKDSYLEEMQAIHNYEKRIELCKDAELKKALQHALKEEKDHAERFFKWLDKCK